MSTHLLNLSKRDMGKYVYRVVKLEHLYGLFESGENVLVSPHKWEDPFEKAIMSAVFPRSGVFGQCWTRHRASDAMWRIYSPDLKRVRIRTTIRDLAKGVQQGDAGTRVYLGAVNYMRERDLFQFVRKAVSTRPSHETRALTILAKRRAFIHEREIRLVWVGERSNSGGDVVRYPFDPHRLISQLMIDPRLPKADAKRLQDEIHERIRFPRNAVLRSLLYTLPPELRQYANAKSA